MAQMHGSIAPRRKVSFDAIHKLQENGVITIEYLGLLEILLCFSLFPLFLKSDITTN
jgi:hypothetical protein